LRQLQSTSKTGIMRLFSECRLYGIVDMGYVSPHRVQETTSALIQGGVDILQLRAKKCAKSEIRAMALQMLSITRVAGVPLVINDHLEIAAEVESEGVHVGQNDGSITAARAVVGKGCFVGKSTHSMEQAEAAQAEGADYIGFGPLYATGTKPDYVPIGLSEIAEVHRRVTLPIFCIGGVNHARLPEIRKAGAQRVVVVSAFLMANDVVESVRALKSSL
jgi:thiamine-phosphate pyrophosphorylase